MVSSILQTKITFYFTVSINDDDFNQITIAPIALEIESFNNEIQRIILEGYFTEASYPFTIKTDFSTLGSIREILLNITGSQTAFTPDNRIDL